MRAREDAASRDGGRESGRGPDVREMVGVVVVVDWRAAKDVVLRAKTGAFRPEDVGAADGSSARSHMAAVDCERVMRSRPLLDIVGVLDMGGSINVFFIDVGVGGVRPRPLPTKVEPVLEPDPSRLPEDEAGRRKFMPMPDARDTLRFPLKFFDMPDTSISSQARMSSSAS